MPRVYLSIGSNREREAHIQLALDVLRAQFGELDISSVYESEAVGFAGDPFYNLVVGLDTGWSVGELARWLKAVEAANGRSRDVPRFSGRTIDLDILTYDDLVGLVDGVTLPREEISENAFVLLPLAEVAGGVRHPVTGESYAAMWAGYRREQRLWPIAFLWHGESISPRAAQA